MKRLYFVVRIAAFVALIALCLTGQTKKHQFSPREKAFYADPALVDFVNPGLTITINSASISSSGAISVTYTLTDPSGLPLDAAGVNTPGAISMTFIASYIPKGQEQYVAYTTASATGPVLGTITRPDFEEGGPGTSVGPGQYQYTLKAMAPEGFDPTVTTTVAVNGSRNLTEFNLGTNYAGATYNFVPNGSAVTVTRDVIRTASCNTCHDQLVFHGGHAFGIQQCVLCHQPQNADPTSGNTLDLKVMAHKIHMGSSLPSVVGTSTTPGVPYEIYGYMNSVDNFSTVVDPAMAQRCEVCHSQTTGAAQAKAFLTEPSRAACGACHDNVNFATGANHPGGIQSDDTQCANCHIPQGEMPFDASIMGAHVVSTDTKATYPQNPDTLIAGINLAITSVTNTTAGQTPTVNYTLQDDKGNNIAVSSTTTLSFTMAGPTTDYGYTSFGSGTSSTPGYVTESVTASSCSSSGACTYTFTHAIPSGATGTYAIGGEARTTAMVPVLTGGVTSQESVEYGAANPVTYFSVDGSTVTPRRTVVAEANCNNCHVALSLHGGLRNNVEYCVLCHNPSNTDASTRATATIASYQTQPAQGINFSLLVHRIHDGANAAADNPKNPYIVVGHGGSINNFSGVLFPGMSATGSAPYLENCSFCHVNSSEQNDLPNMGNLNPVTDPQGWINPIQPISSACSGCHVSKSESAHFLANTDSLGESCSVCHAAGAQFAVDAEHAQ
ncbi:MAG TPA: OmcA/MtrC family decaheme c-type cytochrome [Bryobacteraceae bacterium]|nr:OmcA/MtrC family decaheme c-type cytochrome [Bryobacteraceae bacterium]